MVGSKLLNRSGKSSGKKEFNKEMKYWLYFLAKLLVSAAIVGLLQLTLVHYYPFATMGVWLVAAGLLFVTIRDQRRRCRNCLRRLIMPIARGSWGNMVVLGRPKTEWICPFGHGTLSIEELQITGRQSPDWQPHDDNIWKELESIHQAQK
jgi:hypothetical protein